jgi:hypothetical protein
MTFLEIDVDLRATIALSLNLKEVNLHSVTKSANQNHISYFITFNKSLSQNTFHFRFRYDKAPNQCRLILYFVSEILLYLFLE